MGNFKQVDFNSKEFIYADTNVWLNFLGYNQNGSTDASQRKASAELISTAGNAGAEIVVSALLLNELRNTIVLNSFIKKGYRKQKEIKQLRETAYKNYTYILGQALNDFENYKRKIISDPAVTKDIIGTDEECFKKSEELMRKHNLFGSTDALHLATAIVYGIDYFATFDTDFCGINTSEIKILVHDENN